MHEMHDIHFVTMTDLGYADDVLCMMAALYEDYSPTTEGGRARFPRTIQTLTADPTRGRIVLFIEGSIVCGYALLIPFWSNEFGGTVLLVDELFVKPEARSRGIARGFFRYVFDTRPFDAVAAALEVMPTNMRARQLYESVGFCRRENEYLTCRLREPEFPGPTDLTSLTH
jgi:ribosomal protein S18 acetylase RimI-like enzyme